MHSVPLTSNCSSSDLVGKSWVHLYRKETLCQDEAEKPEGMCGQFMHAAPSKRQKACICLNCILESVFSELKEVSKQRLYTCILHWDVPLQNKRQCFLLLVFCDFELAGFPIASKVLICTCNQKT